ncbi:ribosome biogenesis GTPase Der [Candidatus Sumerlaeota bacterium]|nr:ribosome biogenesis GTPase Der [Candidatus Sumerlaeota bacterium]
MEYGEKIEKVYTRLPVVAIIGRPNVGKSTLFNRLARRRKAMVLKIPGVTRDRNYQQVKWDEHEFLLVDTGGFEPETDDVDLALIREQTQIAIDEADVILFVTDGKELLHPNDELIMQQLRMTRKPVFLLVNKCDTPEREQSAYEFLKLGVDKVYPISATHNINIDEVMNDVVAVLPTPTHREEVADSIRVAIIGKPNVGKSTLLNTILGENRVVVSETPGTTRDAVDTLIKYRGKMYTLIDTAGIKRRGKIKHLVERISISATIMSLERCDIALVVCDATEGITRQDQHIAGYALEAGRGIIIVINKWDLIDKSKENITAWHKRVQYAFQFVEFAPVIYVSALTGKRVDKIFDLIDTVYREFTKRIPTSELNTAIKGIVAKHKPPSWRGRELKIKYATQVANSPPTFVLFTNYPEAIHFSYERYVQNQLRKQFGFIGTPVRLIWRKTG